MSKSPRPLSRFLAPRYWPIWLLLALLWPISRLPYPLQIKAGKLLGSIMYILSRRRRHIATVNLELCFPELDQKQRNILLRDHFKSLGIGLIETAITWWKKDSELPTVTEVIGLEHIDQALAKGKGVLLIGGHFTTLDISGHLLATQTPHPIRCIYRPHENPFIEALIVSGRERSFEKMLPRDNIRELLRSLKQNKIVWYPPDQAYRGKGSVVAPFFGVPAATSAISSRLAKLSGAPVIPYFAQRLPDNRGYRLTVLPPLTDFPGKHDIEDATRINQLLEQQIRQYPEQYFWVHRRFKPSGNLPDVYHDQR